MELDEIAGQMRLLSQVLEESDYDMRQMRRQTELLRERAGVNQRMQELIDRRDSILSSFQREKESWHDEIKVHLGKEKRRQEEKEEQKKKEETENGTDTSEYGGSGAERRTELYNSERS